MPDTRQPRHTIRAQGRVKLGERGQFESSEIGSGQSRSNQSRGSQAGPGQRGESAEKKYSRLLDYLSQSAVGTDRTILDRATTDAVVSSSSAAQLLEAWFNAGSSARAGYGQSLAKLGGNDGADGDADEAALESIDSEGYWPSSNDWSDGAGESGESADAGDWDRSFNSNAGRYPGNYSGGYFGTDSGSVYSRGPGGAGGRNRPVSRRLKRDIESGITQGPAAYLRRLQREAQWASTPEPYTPGENGFAPGSASASVKVARCGAQVEVREEASGSRVETFPSGARVFKDGVGHVREIVSAGGVTVSFKYNEQGHLSAFVRTDACGAIHSLAEADRHGVILRDSGGRVKAQGESMQVDACGCVSIARQDGQFWSLDLVRNVNIERRLLPDEHGNWFSMTALFSSDGFRMATRFRKVKPEDLPMAQGGQAQTQSLPPVTGLARATISGAASDPLSQASHSSLSSVSQPEQLKLPARALAARAARAAAAGLRPFEPPPSTASSAAEKEASSASKKYPAGAAEKISSAAKAAVAEKAEQKRMADGTTYSLPPGQIDFLSEEGSGNYRFYGRDGSIIDFSSDDELKQLKPSLVLPANAREVAPSHRGKRQAGTAWEALREYVFNYLAAL